MMCNTAVGEGYRYGNHLLSEIELYTHPYMDEVINELLLVLYKQSFKGG